MVVLEVRTCPRHCGGVVRKRPGKISVELKVLGFMNIGSVGSVREETTMRWREVLGAQMLRCVGNQT